MRLRQFQRGVQCIGIVAAAGTGLQEVSCLISNAGAGISQAIGTGGRDVKREVGGSKFDAVVFAGPKALLEENVAAEDLKQMGQVDSPMFYMNYILDPHAAPWRDAIGNVVKFFRGAEFRISRPKDLWKALSEMVTRIGEGRKGLSSASAAGR